MATRRIGLNGSSSHIAFDAEKRKISFPLLTTTNVCKEGNYRENRIWIDRSIILEQLSIVRQLVSLQAIAYQYIAVVWIDILERSGGQFRREAALQSNRYWHTLFKCRIRLWTFILVLVIISDLLDVRHGTWDVGRCDVATFVMNEQRTKELRTDILAKRLREHPARHCTCTYRHRVICYICAMYCLVSPLMLTSSWYWYQYQFQQ